jgi:hypothetical protein
LHSRHLTGHAVGLVALGGGEVGWQREDPFSGRGREAAHEFEVPAAGIALGDRVPRRQRRRLRRGLRANRPEAIPRRPALRTALGRVPGLIDWIKTVQGIAAIVAVIFATVVAWWNLGLPHLVFSPELAPIHVRIEALEQFNRETRLLALDQAWWSVNPLGMLWPER